MFLFFLCVSVQMSSKILSVVAAAVAVDALEIKGNVLTNANIFLTNVKNTDLRQALLSTKACTINAKTGSAVPIIFSVVTELLHSKCSWTEFGLYFVK